MATKKKAKLKIDDAVFTFEDIAMYALNFAAEGEEGTAISAMEVALRMVPKLAEQVGCWLDQQKHAWNVDGNDGVLGDIYSYKED